MQLSFINMEMVIIFSIIEKSESIAFAFGKKIVLLIKGTLAGPKLLSRWFIEWLS